MRSSEATSSASRALPRSWPRWQPPGPGAPPPSNDGPPEGYRSVEHFLDTVREFVGRRSGATAELSRYLRVNDASVRRWIKREKMPLQETLEGINRWMISKKAGL